MNYRNTKQRQAILDAIEKYGGHLTADEIYQLVKRRRPSLSLGTVYRNLRVLVEQRHVRELDFGMATAYFEAAKESHYHLICRVCGKIADAELSLERRLMAMVEPDPCVAGFQIEEHRLDFIGVCSSCQSGQSGQSGSLRSARSRRTPKAR
jgi:Fe2+ or Zn2+ uptake regulation protein